MIKKQAVERFQPPPSKRSKVLWDSPFVEKNSNAPHLRSF